MPAATCLLLPSLGRHEPCREPLPDNTSTCNHSRCTDHARKRGVFREQQPRQRSSFAHRADGSASPSRRRRQGQGESCGGGLGICERMESQGGRAGTESASEEGEARSRSKKVCPLSLSTVAAPPSGDSSALRVVNERADRVWIPRAQKAAGEGSVATSRSRGGRRDVVDSGSILAYA
jgi:hypothetical protein